MYRAYENGHLRYSQKFGQSFAEPFEATTNDELITSKKLISLTTHILGIIVSPF